MIAKFFEFILAKINAVVAWIGQLWVSIFVALWDLMKDAVCWVMDTFLSLAKDAVTAIDVSAVVAAGNVFGSIPADVLEVMAALGLGTAFSIIGAAIGIRLVLQLIPFTRLGS